MCDFGKLSVCTYQISTSPRAGDCRAGKEESDPRRRVKSQDGHRQLRRMCENLPSNGFFLSPMRRIESSISVGGFLRIFTGSSCRVSELHQPASCRLHCISPQTVRIAALGLEE